MAVSAGVRTKRVGWALALLAVAAPAAGQEPARDTTGVHVVRRGDTLWDLARQYLENPFLWPEIYRINRDQVEDPDLIFPRERLRIPGLLGFRGDTVPGRLGMQPPQRAGLDARTVFFPQARLDGRTLIGPDDVPSPAVTPGEFYGAGALMPETQLRTLGRLTEVVAPTVVPVEIPGNVHPYQKVYMAMAAPGAVRLGDMVHLIRRGRHVRPFGRVYESTGLATVVEVVGLTAVLEVQELFDAVEIGNLVAPIPEYRVPIGVRPRAAEAGLQGRLVAFEDPQPVHSVGDLAFIDLGRSTGVVEGDELLAVLPPERKEWGLRPEIVVALLQVVRVGEQTSAVRVLSMEHAALEPGVLVRLVGKMPSS